MLYAFPIRKAEEFPWPTLIFNLFGGRKRRWHHNYFLFFTGAALETVQVPVPGPSVDSLPGKQFQILSLTAMTMRKN
jgi:hypothetical protein